MNAVQISSYGGIDVLKVNEIPEPVAGEGQVLVEVHAASINPFDWQLREGVAKEYIKLEFPATIGGDFSGKIVGLDKGVADFAVGDGVYGQAAVYVGGTGAFAEVLTASVGKIAKKPRKTDFLEAAALPLVGQSALQALETHIGLKSGPSFAKASADAKALADRSEGKQKILIHGGAGGIGHVAIQIAKALGAYVATTVSGDDVDFVRGLGADKVIDYENEKFEEKLSEFDAVFDTVGGETTDKSFKVLKKGGILVSMAGAPSEELAKRSKVKAIGQNTQGTQAMLERLAQLVDDGKIKVHIDKVFSLNKVKEAFTHQEKDHPRGKVVLKISSAP